jgi:L-ascorbate metabolism protein UlaG (beta-lactamase superfamily)
MIIAIVIATLVSLAFTLFLRQDKFGHLPTGKRLEVIKQSPNYKDGAFQNQSVTPDLTDGATYFSVMKKFFFEKAPRRAPVDIIPSVKTNLLELDRNSDVLAWFGHSSYFMQVDGKRILVDPVFSGAAAPVSFMTNSFRGTDIYKAADIPEIDYLFISHDHWDHLDYETLLQLKPKIKKIICSLGTGEHLERWGFNQSIVIEKDWNEKIELETGFTAYTVPARHFSGRGLKRNQALWTSYVLQTPTMKIFIGGDSGYDKHFAEAGKTFGPFDLAILENGQYDKSWKHIHMMPEEVITAAKELNAKQVLPVHSSKFKLANHAWDDPLIRVTAASKGSGIRLLTPLIGERVNLKDNAQQFKEWWKEIN